MIGGAKGSRTPDLLNAIQALYQLSYGPTGGPGAVGRRLRGGDIWKPHGMRKRKLCLVARKPAPIPKA